MRKIRECSMCGLKSDRVFKSSKFNKLLCDNHYNQLIYANRSFKPLERTIYTPNSFIWFGGYVEMIIYNKNCEEIARTIFDCKYYPIVSKYKWYLHNTGYACNKSRGKPTLFLHHLIVSKKKSFDVDHIDRNVLNNLSGNLRQVPRYVNSLNKGLKSDNRSGYNGVWWDSDRKKWSARISNMYIGRYKEKELAIIGSQITRIMLINQHKLVVFD